jgi:hypothetical protein
MIFQQQLMGLRHSRPVKVHHHRLKPEFFRVELFLILINSKSLNNYNPKRERITMQINAPKYENE